MTTEEAAKHILIVDQLNATIRAYQDQNIDLQKQHLKAVKSFESEIIGLIESRDHIYDLLEDERKYSAYLSNANQYMVDTQNSKLIKSFFLGLAVGVIFTVAIIALL